ncbi:hypothetical protein [Eubacterium aggregans]|uniref:hypothetical protein n=1 Tax=Eubacterium aggregans TaxID=81409 RepID=UPI003F2B235B
MNNLIIFDQMVIIAGSIVTISTALALCVKPIRVRVIDKMTRDDVARAGICALLRKEIVNSCEKAREQNGLSLCERENLHDMFDQYESLGGNHEIKDIVEEAMELPTIAIGRERKRE